MIKILIAESMDIDTVKKLVEQNEYTFFHGSAKDYEPQHGAIAFFYMPDLTIEQLEQELTYYHALIVRPKQVTAEAILSAPDLKLIIRGGAGVNSIDVATASEQGVIVENTPGQNSVATAEYTIALIMKLVADRQIDRARKDTLGGAPDQPEAYSGQELCGKSIGIVGLGNIGMSVAKLAEAFGMRVAYYSRSEKPVAYARYQSVAALCASGVDVLSLHVPLDEATYQLIGDSVFNAMQLGTWLVNTARPGLVDVKAFKRALERQVIAGAAIDGDLDQVQPFIDSDTEQRCIITHHIADATVQAQQKIAKQAMHQVLSYFKNGQVINQVN